MPALLHAREAVIGRLLGVIRREGYDGASLARLSKATGLGKGSLYHHFPDGKDDMVAAVLAHLETVVETHIIAPLETEEPPLTRLRNMLAAVEAFYRGGRESCLLASLGIGESARPFHPRVKRIFKRWIAALAATLRAGGVPRPASRTRAEDALARIEGALVLARALSEPALFARTLRTLPSELLRP